MYFLDFEASSLEQGSFPIEVAWVDDTGQAENYLITPEVDWTNWSDTSEKLHGITRDVLQREGKPAAWVAQRAYAVLKGSIIYSDNPAFEAYWLQRLLEVIGQPPLPVADLERKLSLETQRLFALITVSVDTPEWYRKSRSLIEQGQRFNANTALQEALRTKHRAKADAEGMWWRWKKVQMWVDQQLTAK